MIQCYNDKDNVGIDEAARPQRQRTGVSAAPLLGETLMIHMRRESVLSGISHWIRYIATLIHPTQTMSAEASDWRGPEAEVEAEDDRMCRCQFVPGGFVLPAGGFVLLLT